MSWRWAFGCALAWLCACEAPLDVSQTIVWVDADSDARDSISRLLVQAVGPTHESEPTVETRDPDWPVKLVIAPKNDDPTRTFSLYIEARDSDGDRRMTLKLGSGFVARQTRHVKLLLHGACVQAKAQCGAGQVCNVWELEVAPAELDRSAQSARALDVTCSDEGVAEPVVNAGAGGTGGATSGAGTGGSSGSDDAGQCDPGYVRMGSGCVDVDDCAAGNPCGDHGDCRNTAGGYSCECESGYEARNGSCVVAVDCQARDGGCETACSESGGVATCSCGEGEWLKADRKACGAFGEARRISGPSSVQRTEPHVAFDVEGNALVVWIEAMPTQSGDPMVGLWARQYSPERGWEDSPRRVMFSDVGVPTAPKVSMASNGRGVIVWTQVEDGDGDIWAARYVDQNPQGVTRIDDAGTTANDATIAINADGNGFAAWTQFDGERSQIWVNQFTPVDGWAGARPIEIEDGGGNGMGGGGDMGGGNMGGGNMGGEPEELGVRLSVDEDGDASLVWTQTGAGAARAVPWTTRFDAASQSWDAPTPLEGSGRSGLADIERFENDQTIAVWPREMDERVAMFARGHEGDGNWQAPSMIAMFESELDAVVPRLSLSPSGAGAVVWAQQTGSQVQVWMNRYDAAMKRWDGAMELSSYNSPVAPQPQLAVDRQGDGFAVWSETHGMRRDIKALRLQADRGYIGNVTLSEDMTPDSASHSAVQIAVDPAGRAIAVWEVFEMGQYTVWASTFE